MGLAVFIGRALPYLAIFAAWYYGNKELDKLGDRETELKAHPFWGKIFFLYGWAIGAKKRLTVVRWIGLAILGFYLLRWFFYYTSYHLS